MRFSLCLLLLTLSLQACGDKRDDATTDSSGAVVLMYHRFGEDQHPSTSVRLKQFDQHLDYLARENFQVWPLHQVARHLTEGRPFPDRVVAISIDDAYRSVYEQAYPRLKARGWPFTVFVSSDATDNKLHDYLSWDQMREMAGNGAQFANHSATHDYLIARRDGESEAQWRQRVGDDIDRAERRLRQELDDAVPSKPALFAYPFGEYDADLRALVGDRGFVAFGQHSGPLGHYSDTLTLPRFAMAENYADMPDFRQRVNTLPFPLLEVSPIDSTAVDRDNPPTLRLRFAAGAMDLDRLNCFAGGSAAKVHWVDRQEQLLEVTATQPLGKGRSRYNCTAPGPEGRFYWFSQQWVRGRR